MKIEFGTKKYHRVHYWLRAKYGKANKCEHPKCEKRNQVFSWALLRNKDYDFKRKNFWQLCKPCHTKYDMTEETKRKIGKFRAGIDSRKTFNCQICRKRFKSYVSQARKYCSNNCRYIATGIRMIGNKYQSQHKERKYV